MPTIDVPPDLVDVLGLLTEATQLRDPQGQIIGTFVPSLSVEESHWTEEELREAERALTEGRDRGRPLHEFWREIEAKDDAE